VDTSSRIGLERMIPLPTEDISAVYQPGCAECDTDSNTQLLMKLLADLRTLKKQRRQKVRYNVGKFIKTYGKSLKNVEASIIAKIYSDSQKSDFVEADLFMIDVCSFHNCRSLKVLGCQLSCNPK
jgi:hypothetical protein